jgi:hypothetical protein
MRGAVVALALSGCLVTDPIEFEAEQGSPPVLLDIPGTPTPLGHIVWLDSRAQSSWRLTLRVRDEDLGQALTAHYRFVREGESTPDFEPRVDVRPTGTLTRDFDISIQAGQLRVGECHRLDVAVSGSFFEGRDSPIFFDEVREEGDLARGTFWLWEGQGEEVATQQEKARLVESCNAIEELLAPAGTTEDLAL